MEWNEWRRHGLIGEIAVFHHPQPVLRQDKKQWKWIQTRSLQMQQEWQYIFQMLQPKDFIGIHRTTTVSNMHAVAIPPTCLSSCVQRNRVHLWPLHMYLPTSAGTGSGCTIDWKAGIFRLVCHCIAGEYTEQRKQCVHILKGGGYFCQWKFPHLAQLHLKTTLGIFNTNDKTNAPPTASTTTIWPSNIGSDSSHWHCNCPIRAITCCNHMDPDNQYQMKHYLPNLGKLMM